MIIECAHCHARYQYDEARFDGKPSKKIRCAKCQQVFEIHNPTGKSRPSTSSATPAAAVSQTQTAASPKSAPAQPPGVRDEALDMTMRGRPRTVEEPLPEPEANPQPEMQSSDSTPRLPVGRRLCLAIIDGPDSGKVYRIEKPKVVIGRTGADMVLNDDEASRHHAALEIRDSVIVLQDLGSTNGTLVDGNRINGQVEIYNQAEFQVGSSLLMLIVTDAEDSPASPR